MADEDSGDEDSEQQQLLLRESKYTEYTKRFYDYDQQNDEVMKSRENQNRQSISLKLLISQNKRTNDISKSISDPFKLGISTNV
jgi:hypothetical protein